ncbi:hypothetical protein DERP_007596 [Dermatophagoides pteronyssinus]|uniref:Uncharacterized protein n=1 Tax=Dermatophagoides pteronyssinus TaxID=6956 RepID=A0ABQ8JK67_DERPT|nr:hypothetical protein DERP_007596 [Dermatophagoides pteronyssinus]
MDKTYVFIERTRMMLMNLDSGHSSYEWNLTRIEASNACIPPCGMIGPQIFWSSRSCTIIRPPNVILPCTSATFFTGHVMFG